MANIVNDIWSESLYVGEKWGIEMGRQIVELSQDCNIWSLLVRRGVSFGNLFGSDGEIGENWLPISVELTEIKQQEHIEIGVKMFAI